MAEYNHELIGTIGVDDESSYPNQMAITVGVDTLGMCVVSFGTSYSIRIPEKDVDALRRILHDASRQLMVQRVNQEGTQNRHEQDYTDAMNEVQRRRYLDLAQCSEV